MTRLLIAYDGSDPARTAVRTAGRLFGGAEAVVVSAYERPPTAAKALLAGGIPNETLEHGIAELHREVSDSARATADEGASLATESGLRAEGVTVVSDGGVWQELIAAARERRVDVIVCGTRGRGGFGRALLGSTSSSLTYHAHGSVLVVPAHDSAPSGPVVVAYDGSDGARGAVESCARLFPGAQVVVVHAWRSPIHDSLTGRALLEAPIGEIRAITQLLEEEAEQAARAVVEEAQALAQKHGLVARVELVETASAPWRSVAEVAAGVDASVVVAGSRGRGGVASVLLGSMSAALVHNAERPTLIVRPSDPA